jgi:hypothetical protein
LELTVGSSSKEKPTVTRAVTVATRSNVADFKAGRNYGEPQLETHDLDQ